MDHDDFQSKIMLLLEMIWVSTDRYTRAIQRLFALNNRNISLVDCLSFEIMDSREISHAFTFDKHFAENGFTIAVFHDLDIE